MKVILLVLIFLPFISCQLIQTLNGAIQGKKMVSRKGVKFDAFMKIPYAEKPIGKLRFQPPIKKSPWSGVRDATNYGPMCTQVRMKGDKQPMDEDCLHLNVFTKNLENKNLKPVLVFIHGGSFEVGSSSNHGPEYLMDRDLVLVTINYRLAAFGFLAAGTNKATGNMGLKDQVMALQWVQDNIKIFGGDPQQVTISGLSAGAFSVSSHLISNMSRGLFNRAILMSGSITWMSRMNQNYKELANYIASQLNCESHDIVECLQEVPAEKIIEVDPSPTVACPTMIWNPVIEEDFGQERFFTENPLDVFKDSPSKFKGISVMMGTTSNEIIYAAQMILANPNLSWRIENDLHKFIYECFYFKSIPTDVNQLKQFYLPFDKIDQRSFEGVGKLASDGMISYGVHRLVHLMSNYTDVYYYKFSYSGQNSVYNYPRNSPYGITHADDIQYLFNTWYVSPIINEKHPDNLMVERMTRLWEQFVWHGDPNNSTDEYLRNVLWPKHDYENEYYLDIGTHMVEKHGLFLERFAAWDHLSSSVNNKLGWISKVAKSIFKLSEK